MAEVDLSNLQGIDFGGGQGGYFDPSTNTYYDSGGNVLSAADLSQYGAFTVTSPGSYAPTPGAVSAPASGSGSGGALSGLTSLFGTFANGIINATRPPTLQTASGQSLIYNPRTGQYVPTTAINAQAALSPLVLLLLGGVVIYLIVREA